MHMTTLTAIIAIVAFSALLGVRPAVSARNAGSEQPCRVVRCATPRQTSTEQFPRLSRNHWVRQDISRMLMTDDDYTGRITPQSRQNHDQAE